MRRASIIGRGRAGSGIAAAAAAQGALPAGFVYLRAVDPSIAQDIRYAGSDNFVGRPLPGYEAAECILRRDVAAALKRVQADLAASGLSLKVYDCYRPTRAVRAMAAWVNDGRSQAATKRFFPKLAKSSLLRAGYIASQSRHSAGTTIDLTLMRAGAAPAPAFDQTAGPCANRALQITIMNGGTFPTPDPLAPRRTIFRSARPSAATVRPPWRPGSSSRCCRALPAS